MSPAIASLRDEFQKEMKLLARGAWGLFCITDDLARHDDYVRGLAFGQDLFVQNVEGAYRGYRNTCARRGGPIYRARRGHGDRPLRHLHDLDAVRVEVVGRFLFVSLSASAPPVREYLGPYGDVLDAVSANLNALIYREEKKMSANWKLGVEITLDDYHVPFVHPTTFGAGEPPKLFQYVYRRDGAHSCYFRRRDPDWDFASYWEGLREGIVDTTGYKIFQMFPTACLFTYGLVCVVSINVPLGSNATSVETYIFDWKKAPLSRAESEDAIAYATTFLAEDRTICEELAQSASYVTRAPRFGKLEERVGWFREAYERSIRGDP